MNARLLFLIFAFSIYYIACAKNGPKTVPSQEEITQGQQEVQRAQTLVEQQVEERMTADRAKQLAARHLALKQTSWGKPTGITEDEDNYFVSYETPQRERRLIGSRVLIVNKHTGLVVAQKRR